AGVVDHHYPVAITVEGNTQVRAMLDHGPLQLTDVSRTHVGIDVQAIGLRRDHHHLRTQFAEDARSDLVGGAVGTIKHYLQPREVGTGRHAALAELDVATGSVVDPRSLAQLGRLDHRHRRIEQLLDHQL